MLIVAVMTLILDPFFIYVPCAKGPRCLGIDVQASYFFTTIRTLFDSFHFLHIVMKFRVAFEGNGPKVFKSRNLVMDPLTIAIHYFKSRFILDLLAALPLPQVRTLARAFIRPCRFCKFFHNYRFKNIIRGLFDIRTNIKS